VVVSKQVDDREARSRTSGEVIGMQPAPAPANVAEALSMLDTALDHLAAADWASLPPAVRREALTGPGRSEADRGAHRRAGRRMAASADQVRDAAGLSRMDTRAMMMVPLSQLRQMPGASELENAWITARAGECGWLTGPAGLAGYLRTRLPGTGYTTASLPLDVGYSDKIPDHIRRAVILRDRHCAWPGGCDKSPAGCHIHHLVPKAQGGKTRLK
jgi:hypothetical protein